VEYLLYLDLEYWNLSGDHVDGAFKSKNMLTHFFQFRSVRKECISQRKEQRLIQARGKRERQVKAKKQLVESNIQAARTVTCCIWQYYLAILEEVMRKLRFDYWGSKHDKKLSYMLALFETRPKQIIDLDKYVVQECTICANGFYTIFGFEKLSITSIKDSMKKVYD
jgi:hypothetical protein